MAKRINKIKKIQIALDKIMEGTKNLIDLNTTLEDKELKGIIDYFALLYATLNLKLSTCLLCEFPKYINKDKVDRDFNKLMKPLEKELKDRNDNRKK